MVTAWSTRLSGPMSWNPIGGGTPSSSTVSTVTGPAAVDTSRSFRWPAGAPRSPDRPGGRWGGQGYGARVLGRAGGQGRARDHLVHPGRGRPGVRGQPLELGPERGDLGLRLASGGGAQVGGEAWPDSRPGGHDGQARPVDEVQGAALGPRPRRAHPPHDRDRQGPQVARELLRLVAVGPERVDLEHDHRPLARRRLHRAPDRVGQRRVDQALHLHHLDRRRADLAGGRGRGRSEQHQGREAEQEECDEAGLHRPRFYGPPLSAPPLECPP